jgi:hypothetical protein
MKNKIQSAVLLVFGFLCSFSLVAKDKTVSAENSVKTDTTIRTDNSEYPFFSFEYLVTSSQIPASKKYNLSGLKTNFSVLSTELNYGWYLDKNKEKSILLASLGYSYFKTNIAETTKYTNMPAYILSIPNLHHFSTAAIYNQKLKKGWYLSGYGSLSITSDLKHKITNIDYNITLFTYIQKQINNFKIGAGYASYLIGNSVPIGYISYGNNTFGFELLMPVSFKANYKFRRNNMLQLTTNLNFGGYSVYSNETSVSHQPDYADITDFDMRFSYDREFADNLHLNIGLGYWSREISFLEKNAEVDNLIFNETVFLSSKIYYTF